MKEYYLKSYQPGDSRSLANCGLKSKILFPHQPYAQFGW
jgi:hypothetical protein